MTYTVSSGTLNLTEPTNQYCAEPFEQQQFGTAGVEGVNTQFNVYLSV